MALALAACPPTNNMMADSGTDVTTTDTGVTEGGGGEAGMLCNRVPIENLESLGMRMGTTLRYSGDNMSAMEAPTAGQQTNTNIQQLNGCAFRTAYQRVFAYTAQSDAVLRVTTNNTGTAQGFDTTLLVYSSPCPATTQTQGRAFLGCNDDDLAFDGDNRTIKSSLVTIRKVMRGTTVYISVGGFVPATGSDRNAEGERGAFELSVEELPVVAAGAMCDARRLTNACDDGSTCVGSSFTSPTGTCRANGTAAGAACNMGACSGAGLECNTEVGLCVQANIPDGMPCNPFQTCGATSTCVSLQRGLTQGVCRANGSVVGARCDGMGACGAGLRCVTPPGGAEGTCLTAVTMAGGACSTWDTSCPMGEDCVSESVLGTPGTCRPLGSVAGADCDAMGACSSAAMLTCSMRDTVNVCTGSRATGQPCGVFDECAMGGTCYLNEPNNRTQGTCFAPGVRGGPCRAMGTPCDAGLTCSDMAMPANGRCLAMGASGAMCDLATDCAENTLCVRTSMPGMPFAGTCRPFGTAGSRCRSTGMRCDAGLTCSSSATADGICQSATTAACDANLATNRCPTGQVCRATSLTAGTCAAPTMESEPNDAVAASLTATAVPAAIQGSLSLADVDCFAVAVPAMGRIFARANNPSGLCSAELALDLYRLEGANVRLLGGDTNGGAYGCPRIDGSDANYRFASNLAAGTYYVCVRNDADNRAPVSQYALSLNATAM
ncbi:MAG: hypothetical protein JNK05_36970 [Myxococcales bacterium]|nr:hypothetical protein [Myxococcales bacterium]